MDAGEWARGSGRGGVDAGERARGSGHGLVDAGEWTRVSGTGEWTAADMYKDGLSSVYTALLLFQRNTRCTTRRTRFWEPTASRSS